MFGLILCKIQVFSDFLSSTTYTNFVPHVNRVSVLLVPYSELDYWLRYSHSFLQILLNGFNWCVTSIWQDHCLALQLGSYLMCHSVKSIRCLFESLHWGTQFFTKKLTGTGPFSAKSLNFRRRTVCPVEGFKFGVGSPNYVRGCICRRHSHPSLPFQPFSPVLLSKLRLTEKYRVEH